MTTHTQEIQQARQRRWVLIGITVVFIIAAVAYGFYFEQVLTKREQTDNAYVNGNVVTLSSQVAGTVLEIGADETQLVQSGAVVLKLDALDSDVAFAQSQARLGAAVRSQRERYALVSQFDATVALRRLDLKKAQDDLSRRLPLADDHTLSDEEIAHARQAVTDSQALLNVALKQAEAAPALPVSTSPTIRVCSLPKPNSCNRGWPCVAMRSMRRFQAMWPNAMCRWAAASRRVHRL